MESARGHLRSAAGLVLLVLLGGGAGRLPRSRCVCGGQQLAGRVHALAAVAGPAGDVDRLELDRAAGGRPLPGRRRLLRRRIPDGQADEGDAAGEGGVPLAETLRAGEGSIAHAIIEYDNPPGDVFEAIAASLAFLREGGFVR